MSRLLDYFPAGHPDETLQASSGFRILRLEQRQFGAAKYQHFCAAPDEVFHCRLHSPSV